jgi:hypothetical protein
MRTSMAHYCLPLLLMGMTGCSGGTSSLPKAPVAGIVTYQGRPLSTGRVVFYHQSGQAVAGDVGADGVFKLIAFQSRNQVAIECVGPEQPNPNGRPRILPGRSLIPNRYTDFSTSGLTIEVKPGQNQADFALTD